MLYKSLWTLPVAIWSSVIVDCFYNHKNKKDRELYDKIKNDVNDEKLLDKVTYDVIIGRLK
jgi:hypothetical protein